MMTMMMMQRLLQNNNNNNNSNNNNNNNNVYADEMRLNGIRHHSASPFSKPAAVQAASPDSCVGEPDALTSAGCNEPQLQPVLPQFASTGTTAATIVQTGPTCTTVVTVAAADDRLTSDEDDELNVDELNVDELNVDEDPVDLTNNRLNGGRVGGGHGLLNCDRGAGSLHQQTAGSAVAVVPMDTTAAANDYETSGNSKGRLAFSVENILDPNKFTRKLMVPSAVLPRWRPRVDFSTDPSGAGE